MSIDFISLPSQHQSSLSSSSVSNTVATTTITTAVNSQSLPGGLDKNKSFPTKLAKRKQSKSRNGCITCKLKRLKCDETKPACLQCTRRKLVCQGYRKNLKWKVAVSSSASTKCLPEVKLPPISLDDANSFVNYNIQSFSSPELLICPPGTQDGVQSYDSGKHEPDEDASDSLYSSLSPTTSTLSMSASYSLPYSSTLSPTSPAPTSTYFSVSPEPTLRPGVSVVNPSPLPTEALIAFDRHLEIFVANLQSPAVVALCESNTAALLQYSGLNLCSHAGIEIDHSSIFMPLNTLQPHFSDTSFELLALRFDRVTSGVLSLCKGPNENLWKFHLWPLAQSCPALLNALFSLTSFHASVYMPHWKCRAVHFMKQSINLLRVCVNEGKYDEAIATLLTLVFCDSWNQHVSSGLNFISAAKILIIHTLVNYNAANRSSVDVERLKFLVRTWIYVSVISRLTCKSTLTDPPLPDEQLFTLPDTLNTLPNNLPYGPVPPPPVGVPLSSVEYVIDENPDQPDYASLSHSIESDVETFIINFFSLETKSGIRDLDPLMGCATSLFPLIGRVASLVQHIRSSPVPSRPTSTLISMARCLQCQLEYWQPYPFYRDPEDSTTKVQHCIFTAEAYRYAALLYLHQAVSQLSSLNSYSLARCVFRELSRVPVTSPAIIVHIFPLLVASGEAVRQDDRDWILARWEYMWAQMGLGLLIRCRELISELWSRRDAHFHQRTQLPSTSLPPDITLTPSLFEHFKTDSQFIDILDSFSLSSSLAPTPSPPPPLPSNQTSDSYPLLPADPRSSPLPPVKLNLHMQAPSSHTIDQQLGLPPPTPALTSPCASFLSSPPPYLDHSSSTLCLPNSLPHFICSPQSATLSSRSASNSTNTTSSMEPVPDPCAPSASSQPTLCDTDVRLMSPCFTTRLADSTCLHTPSSLIRSSTISPCSLNHSSFGSLPSTHAPLTPLSPLMPAASSVKLSHLISLDNTNAISPPFDSSTLSNDCSLVQPPLTPSSNQYISSPLEFPFDIPCSCSFLRELVVCDLDFEYTTQGKLNWSGLMREWDWEVLLG